MSRRSFVAVILIASGCAAAPPPASPSPTSPAERGPGATVVEPALDAVLVDPLYTAEFIPEQLGQPLQVVLPAPVLKAVAESEWQAWSVALVDRLDLRERRAVYRLLLSSGQSGHPSQDRWVGLHVDAGGTILATWQPAPRVGALEPE